MGTPVVVVPEFGMPVTETEAGTPLTVSEDGFGIPVVVVVSGGLPITFTGGQEANAVTYNGETVTYNGEVVTYGA